MFNDININAKSPPTLQLEKYITSTIDMALGQDGETSFNNSFQIKVTKDGFYYIPNMPAGYAIDNALYQRIFGAVNAAVYPRRTLLKQSSMYLVPLDTNDIHVQRALFFPWINGVSKRLVIPNLSNYVKTNVKLTTIPVMQNFTVNYDKVVGGIIAGNSGSGKSYFLTYLLECLRTITERNNLIVVDPKMDTPTRWAKVHQIKVIYPQSTRSKSDFVNQVSQVLSEALKLIYQRQKKLLQNPQADFKHVTIVIDEVLALTEGINKAIKESFFSLLSQIALLGRATRIHLILVSQRFDYNTIPISVREQLNLRIQLGNINKKTTAFLFPDLDPSGIVIPMGKGTGLIQVIDDEHPYQVLPLLCPTYYLK